MKHAIRKNQHGGDVKAVTKSLGLTKAPKVQYDFSVNINPLGPPACVHSIVAGSINDITIYPDIWADKATEALASAHKVPAECVIAGNGSTEILSLIIQTLKPHKPVWPVPCYAGYPEICNACGIKGHPIKATSGKLNFEINPSGMKTKNADMIFLASPNNPTGVLLDPAAIISFAKAHKKKWIVLDESFMDFAPDAGRRTLIRPGIPKNIIVVKSLTKFFAIPGLRLGMAYAHPEVIRLIRNTSLPWSVNTLAQKVAVELYNDKKYIALTRATVNLLRRKLVQELKTLDGYTVYPSSANFVLVKLPGKQTSSKLQKKLLQNGILIRSCANFEGLGEQYCRIAVRPENEIQELITAIKSPSANSELSLSAVASRGGWARETSPLMIVGTMSNSGKSVIAAAFCRYLKRKGLKAAPFKAQNMALNSFVTAEGGEMGRAQVVQAQAAGIPPHTDMNPVLLKPTGETGSQVIVNGKPIGNFPAKGYYKMKNRMQKAAHDAYDRLSSKHDIIVLEGAGSPAEINLMNEDFVNMAMAEYAKANVILVADIDRGGVFASIYGTINLLPEKYRRMIKGIIINKFRGDESLLKPGIVEIEKLTGIPVLGVIPLVRDLRIEDEDSLGLDNRRRTPNAILDISVIRLHRISNYTDFFPLEKTNGVSVRFLDNPDELKTTDLLIIPGSKNTRADLQFLQDSGWAAKIVTLTGSGVPVFGICGGYQMLGNRVSDPKGVEGPAGEDIGLNLLPLSTVLEEHKELAQVEGMTSAELPFVKKNTPFSGYEIHAGRTVSNIHIATPLTITKRCNKQTDEPAGSVSDDGLVFGCYIHGLFENTAIKNQLLDWLCKRKNTTPPEWDSGSSVDDEFDRLADLLESKLNLTHLNI